MTNPDPHPRAEAQRRHWRSVLKLTGILLVLWFLAGPVLGILLADQLESIRLGGFPLGFWFAQQGSIIIFVILIAAYAVIMNHLDNRYHRDIASLNGPSGRREDQ